MTFGLTNSNETLTRKDDMRYSHAASLFRLGAPLFFATPALVLAQEAPQETVREVTIQGNKRREPEAILREVRSKVGEGLNDGLNARADGRSR